MIPVGAKVRFLITSADVIHSWWVPALAREEGRHSRLRQRILDAHRRARHLPRPVHRTVRQGPRLHAGGGRGQEPGRLRRLAGRTQGRGGAAQGADRQAMDPRRADGARRRRSTRPIAPPVTSRAARACRRCSRRSRVRRSPPARWTRTSNIVFNGKPGTAMAAFGKQLSEVDIAAVITYERNALGNNVRRHGARRRTCSPSSRRRNEDMTDMSAVIDQVTPT